MKYSYRSFYYWLSFIHFFEHARSNLYMPNYDISITVDHPISIDKHRSVEYGVLLALHLKATIHLLHVIQLETLAGLSSPKEVPISPDEVGSVTRIQRRVRTQLEALRQRIEHMSKEQVPVEIHIKAGHPDQRITTDLNQLAHPLAVVSRDATLSTWEYLWGNSITELMKRSKASLLVVPEEVPFRPLRQVTYLFQGDPHEIDDMRQLAQLLAPFDARVQLVGITQPVLSADDLGQHEQALRLALPTAQEPTAYLSADGLANQLKEYLSPHQAGMLAMHHQSKGLFARLLGQDPVREMIFKASIPLLILKNQ